MRPIGSLACADGVTVPRVLGTHSTPCWSAGHELDGDRCRCKLDFRLFDLHLVHERFDLISGGDPSRDDGCGCGVVARAAHSLPVQPVARCPIVG